jgi:putative nucleotidyltransferase with HDIG domain
MQTPLDISSKANQGKRILSQILAARKNLQLYPSDHPMFTQSIDEMAASLKAQEQDKVTFTIFEDEFYFEGELLILESASFQELSRILQERGIQSVTFCQGVTSEEIFEFVQASCREPSFFKEESFFEKLEKSGVRNISGGIIAALPIADSSTEDPKSQSTKDLYASAVETIREAMNVCKSGKAINIRQVRSVVSSLIDLARSDEPALLILTAIKDYDEYTYYHSVNVCILSLGLGMRLGLSEKALNLLGCAALLHDVGKILIPTEILNKPQSLSEEEKEILKEHAIQGAKILTSLPHPYRYSAIIALEHHKRYEMTKHLAYDDSRRTHVFSRIVQIADVYDASASRRSYKKPWLPGQSVRYLLTKSGSLFDPVLTRIFTELIGLYPIGSLVEMNTRELALVIDLNSRDVRRPKVKIIRDETDRDVEEPFEVELAKDQSRTIVNFLSPQEYGIDIMKYI